MPRAKMKYPMETWKWHGLPGHFIAASNCHFRLHTEIGPHRISTVGAYYPDRTKEMEEIGVNRHYETYVFVGNTLSEIDSEGLSLDDVPKRDGYKADELAEQMHLKMCLKYAE